MWSRTLLSAGGSQSKVLITGNPPGHSPDRITVTMRCDYWNELSSVSAGSAATCWWSTGDAKAGAYGDIKESSSSVWAEDHAEVGFLSPVSYSQGKDFCFLMVH